MPEPSPTILVADDHPLFREAMRDVVDNAFPGSLILEAENFPETANSLSENKEIELVLLDLKMPGMNGFSGFIALRNAQPATPIVLVTAEKDPSIVAEARACGAAGFINKSLSRAEMIEALQKVVQGELYFPDVDLDIDPGSQDPADDDLSARIAQLTQQQRKVLDLVASGLANKVIAYELGVTESTVKAHVSAILKKLHVHSRTQLALIVNNLR